MLRKHKNEIFTLFSNSFLDISKVEFVETASNKEQIVVINIKDTQFKYVIHSPNHNFYAFNPRFTVFSPDFQFSEFEFDDYKAFPDLTQSIERWLFHEVSEYFDDLKEPDLWQEYITTGRMINPDTLTSDYNDLDKFSLEEKLQINLAIQDLKLLITKNFKVTKQEFKVVNERLEYLNESTARLNKGDWKNVAWGALFNITVALSLDTDKGAILFNLFKQVFSVIPRIPMSGL